MKIIIREAKPTDFPAILEMISELAIFEKAPEKVTNSVEQMVEEQDCFKCLVAVNGDGQVIAMALYYFAYYTWVGKSLYLDDLYVKENYRGQSIGSQLLNTVFEVAREANCKRVRWQVLNWNTPAIELYKKAGADIDAEWSNCDFDEQGIRDFKL